MRSLRGRLGALVSAAVLLVVVVASLAITVARWSEDNGGLVDRIELAAFDLSETRSASSAAALVPGEPEAFVVVLDSFGEVLAQSGPVATDLFDLLISDVWAETTEQDTAVTVEYDEGGMHLVVSGVACVDQGECDSVVVGGADQELFGYLSTRWWQILGPAALAAVGAWFTARWLVGRSLQPVDEMRRELESITATDLDRSVPVPGSGDELERLGLALNQTIQRLSVAVSANERFAADAAHELRSPIAGVRIALEVEAARSPGGLTADSVRELDRASRLIDDLLVLARHSGQPIRRTDVDLDDIARQEISLLAERFPAVNIECEIGPARLSGDPNSLRRVLDNLLENACRHGGSRVAVKLSAHESHCRLIVDDDGEGIPVDERTRIFERFARLDDSRSRATGGSGLGLAITAEIVAGHNGTVTATESPLGGARFELILPTD